MFDTTLGCVVSIGAFVFGACRVFVGFATVGFRVYALWLRVCGVVVCGWGVGVGWGVLGGCRGCWGCGGFHKGLTCVGAWGVYNEKCPVQREAPPKRWGPGKALRRGQKHGKHF